MQTIANKSVLRSAVASRPARVSRSAVVVRATAESRRAVLTGLVAGAAAISTGAARAATPVDIIDDRKAKETGFDIIYEARDLSLDQATRDGLTQPRADLEQTKARVRLSEARIDKELEPYIQKSYWVLAREQLRLQVGTLRFDLNVLADTKPKEARKKAQELKKAFFTDVEGLDFALRSKNLKDSLTKLEVTKQGLDAVLASLA